MLYNIQEAFSDREKKQELRETAADSALLIFFCFIRPGCVPAVQAALTAMFSGHKSETVYAALCDMQIKSSMGGICDGTADAFRA